MYAAMLMTVVLAGQAIPETASEWESWLTQSDLTFFDDPGHLGEEMFYLIRLERETQFLSSAKRNFTFVAKGGAVDRTFTGTFGKITVDDGVAVVPFMLDKEFLNSTRWSAEEDRPIMKLVESDDYKSRAGTLYISPYRDYFKVHFTSDSKEWYVFPHWQKDSKLNFGADRRIR